MGVSDSQDKGNGLAEAIRARDQAFQSWVSMSDVRTMRKLRSEMGLHAIEEKEVPCVGCGKTMISEFEVYKKMKVRRQRRCSNCNSNVGIFPR